jgi:hypothetical protein
MATPLFRDSSGTTELELDEDREDRLSDIFDDTYIARWRNRKILELPHQNGTGSEGAERLFNILKTVSDAERAKTRSWVNELAVVVANCFMESDIADLREDLLLVLAVTVAWVEDLDRKDEEREALAKTVEVG